MPTEWRRLGLEVVPRFVGEQVRTGPFRSGVKSVWVTRAAALKSQYYRGGGLPVVRRVWRDSRFKG